MMAIVRIAMADPDPGLTSLIFARFSGDRVDHPENPWDLKLGSDMFNKILITNRGAVE